MNQIIPENLPPDLISFAESYLKGYGVTLHDVIWKPLTGEDRTAPSIVSLTLKALLSWRSMKIPLLLQE